MNERIGKNRNIDALAWGALFQIGWLKTESDYTCVDDLGDGYTETDEGTEEFSVYNMEIAVGPTWKAAEGLSIYGGPFFNLINGEIDDDGTYVIDDGEVVVESGTYSDSADVKQDSSFGGYVGAQWDFAANASLFGEFQLTGAGWTFGTGVGWKF